VVDVFDTDGNLLTPNHFAANAPGAGPLENPWAVVQAPANFGAFSNDLLIGNVEGAGNINAFDPATGAYLGQLRRPDGTPVAIAGLWDLVFGTGTPDSGKTDQLFFDGGPNAPDLSGNGLFGVIRAAGDQGGNSQASHPVAAVVGPGTVKAANGVSALDALPHGDVGDGDVAPLGTAASPRLTAGQTRSVRFLPNQAVPAPDRWGGPPSLRPDGTRQPTPSAATRAGRSTALAGDQRGPLDEILLDHLARALIARGQ
jgi:hypothetical protein